jgi:ATP-dependent Clp protease protease subunit
MGVLDLEHNQVRRPDFYKIIKRGEIMLDKEEKAPNIPPIEDYHYYLFNDDFNTKSTGDLIKFILERNLLIKNKPKNIKLIINSPGGEIVHAFALIDVIKGSKIPIYTYALGEIASAGLLTFVAGIKGKRFITSNTSILSHQFSGGMIGKEHELMSRVKDYQLTSKRIITHLKKCTKLSERDIHKLLLPPEDVWLTAKEAVKYGIADKIVDFY